MLVKAKKSSKPTQMHKLTPVKQITDFAARSKAERTTPPVTPVQADRSAAAVVTPDTSDVAALMRISDHGIRGETIVSRSGRKCHVKITTFKDTAVSTKSCNKQLIGIHGGAYRGAQCKWAPLSAY